MPRLQTGSKGLLYALLVIACTTTEVAGSVQCAPAAKVCPLPPEGKAKPAFETLFIPREPSWGHDRVPQRVAPHSTQQNTPVKLQREVAQHLQAVLQRGKPQQQEQHQQQQQPAAAEPTKQRALLQAGTSQQPGPSILQKVLSQFFSWAGSQLQAGPAGSPGSKPPPPPAPKPKPPSPAPKPGPQPKSPTAPAVQQPLPSSWDPSLLYMRGGALTVGIDCKKGGTIAHLSSSALPAPWTNVNLVNTFDTGRVIQQSYYGCTDGSCWAKRPWSWNPVQGGSWQNWGSKILQCSAQEQPPQRLVSKVRPRNWGGQQVMYDVTMETSLAMVPASDAVKVRFTMYYRGTASHPVRIQEVPAVFVDRRLGVLAVYNGSKPWTNAPIAWLMPPGTNMNVAATENWAAYVDAATGYGLGVYVPISGSLTSYRIGPDSKSAKSDCSYFAMTTRFALTPGMAYEYDAWLAVGRVDEMRATFARIRAQGK